MKNEFLLRLKSVLLLLMLFLLFMAMSMSGQAQTVSIFTDQDDYSPGEYVIITGSGWVAGDQVELTITHIGDYIPAHTHTPWTLTADANGNLYDEWFVADMELNTTMWLQAYSLSDPSMKAEKIFTDSQVYSIGPNPGAPGETFTISGVGFGNGVTWEVCFVCVNDETNFECFTPTESGTDQLTGTIPDLSCGSMIVKIHRKSNGNDQVITDNAPPIIFNYPCTIPAITSATAAVSSICPDATTTVTANGVVGTNAVLTWWTGSGGTGTNLGSDNPLTVGPGTYYARVTGDCGTPVEEMVTVEAKVALDKDALYVEVGTNPICQNDKTTLTASGIVGTNAVLTWYTGPDGTGTNLGTANPLTVGPGNYYARVTGDCGAPFEVWREIQGFPYASAGTVNAGTTPQCIGESTYYTVSGENMGGYGWSEWSSSNPNIATVNWETGEVTAVAAGTCDIIYTVWEGCGGTKTAKASYSVNPQPTFSSISVLPSVVCMGDDVATLTISGLLDGETTFNFDLTIPGLGTSSGEETNTITGGTLTTPYTLRFAGEYKLKINSITVGGCTTILTENNEAIWTALPDAAVSSVSGGTSPLCIGATTTCTANDVVLGGGHGEWFSTSPLVASVDASGVVTALSAGSANITYMIKGGCNGTPSAYQTIVVNPDAAVASVSGTTPLCPGSTATYTAVGVELGGGSGAWSSSDETVATVDQDGQVTAVNAGNCNIIYTVTGCNGPASAQKALKVNKPTTITNQPTPLTTIVYGCDAPLLTVVADGEGTLKYQWYKNTINSNTGGTAIIGATQSSYQTLHNYSIGNYYYYLRVTGACGVLYSDVAVVTITPQIAQAVGDIYYTGPTMAWTTSATSNTATVTLSATIKNGEPCGDIRTALVTFTVNGQPIPSAKNLPVGFIDPNYPEKGGTASAIVQLNIANTAASEIFDIGVIISGNYTNGSFVPGDVTIVRPKPGGVIAGGGFLCSGNPSGYVKGVGYLNFYVEYAMKGKSVTNPKGKVNLTVVSRNKPDGTVDRWPHFYSISSNAIASLNITSPTATFSGKANISEFNILTGATTAIEGNCQMVLDLTDGSPDLAGITIQRNGGGVWYSNNWVNTNTVKSGICGEISVTGTPSAMIKVAEITTAISPVVLTETTLKVYPNPFTERLNIEFGSPNDTQAKLDIFNIAGSKLQTLFNGSINGGQLYQVEYSPKNVSSQMLFYHLTLNGKTQVGKVIYNERR
jgi:uncharacterized protein YjdB